MATALCLNLVLLFAGSVSAQTMQDKKLPVSPEVKTGKLANGITYYIRKNKEPEKRAELRLVVNAGSILENEKQLGLAHFTEHMAFNGTKNFKKQELIDFLEKSGVQFGADLNAYTSFDETVYQLQLPTDSPAVYQKGFQILEDWAHNVTFDPAEIDKERGVVIEEWRLGLGANERMRAKFFPVILKGSQYVNRLPIGTKKSLETFDHKSLTDFYKTWYRPDLQAVIVVGDIDVNETEKLIRDHFSRIPKAANPTPRKKFGVPAQKGTQSIILTDPEQPYNVVQIFYKQPQIPEPQTELQYRAMLVREIFNTIMGERLQELAQKPDAPFLYGSSSYGQFYGDKDALTLIAVAKDGKSISRSINTVLVENERVRQHGFTEGELERAKTALLSNIETLYQERDKTRSANMVQELIDNYLHKEPIPGIEYEFGLYQKYVPGITLKEVNSLITKWMAPNDRAVVVTAPESEKKNLLNQVQLLAILNKPLGKLKAYEDKTMKGSLLAKEPVAGKVANSKTIEALGVTELTLSNGAKVILKPTNFKNNEIIFSAISPGGTSLYRDEDYLSAVNATSLVLNGGVGNYDVMSLQKALTGKQVSVSPSIGQYSEGFNGYSTPKDLETALQLLHGYFVEPRKDSSMYLVYLQQSTASLVNKGKDPNSVFGDSVSYIMGNYHPRRKPLTIESLNQIQLSKGLEIYKDRFADASDFIFTFVGNFKVDSITPLLEKYIASLPATGRKETAKDVGIRFPQGVVNKVIQKGKEDKSNIRIAFTGTTKYSDLESVQLDQLSKVLALRLREVLREDQGGVYGVGVRSNISREPIEAYGITVSFGSSPQNLDKLTNLVLEEIKNLKANGAPQGNIEKVIAEDTRAMETEVRDNGYWLYNLEDKYYHKEDPTLILQDKEMVKKLTVERTKELANKYFNDNNVIKISLLPEPK